MNWVGLLGGKGASLGEGPPALAKLEAGRLGYKKKSEEVDANGVLKLARLSPPSLRSWAAPNLRKAFPLPSLTILHMEIGEGGRAATLGGGKGRGGHVLKV